MEIHQYWYWLLNSWYFYIRHANGPYPKVIQADKNTFIVHIPVVLPDRVVVGAGRWSGREVGGNAAHNWPLRLWRGNPTSRRTDLASWAKRPERRVVEVIDGTDQWAHLDGVHFLVVSFEALGQTGLEVAAGVKKNVLVSVTCESLWSDNRYPNSCLLYELAPLIGLLCLFAKIWTDTWFLMDDGAALWLLEAQLFVKINTECQGYVPVC